MLDKNICVGWLLLVYFKYQIVSSSLVNPYTSSVFIEFFVFLKVTNKTRLNHFRTPGRNDWTTTKEQLPKVWKVSRKWCRNTQTSLMLRTYRCRLDWFFLLPLKITKLCDYLNISPFWWNFFRSNLSCFSFKVIHYHLTKIQIHFFFFFSETETRERDVATEDRVVRS